MADGEGGSSLGGLAMVDDCKSSRGSVGIIFGWVTKTGEPGDVGGESNSTLELFDGDCFG